MYLAVAKNFQDYYVNVITQRLGAQIYTDGIRHSLQLPFNQFEDQRSGTTLGILQKVRSDTERLINAVINTLFTTVVGVIFVTVYSISVYWLIAPIFFSAIPILGVLSSVLSEKIKKHPENNRIRNHGSCRIHHRIIKKYRTCKKSWTW